MSWWDDVVGGVSSAVGWVDDNIVQPGAGYSQDAWRDVSKAATDAYNYSYSLASNTQATAQAVARTIDDASSNMVKQGYDVTEKEFVQGYNITSSAFNQGAQAVEKAATDAYEWVDANACKLGLTMALSSECVAAFTPKAPGGPAFATNTAMAGIVVSSSQSAGIYAAAIEIEPYITPVVYPLVRGQVSKSLLSACIVNGLYYSMNTNLMLWTNPMTIGVAISTLICPLVSTLVCDGIVPHGWGNSVSPSGSANLPSQGGGLKIFDTKDNRSNYGWADYKTWGSWLRDRAIWGGDANHYNFQTKITMPISGYVNITTTCDNAVKLYIDNDKVIEVSNWQQVPTKGFFLNKGSHTLRCDCENWGGPAGMGVYIITQKSAAEIKQIQQVS